MGLLRQVPQRHPQQNRQIQRQRYAVLVVEAEFAGNVPWGSVIHVLEKGQLIVIPAGELATAQAVMGQAVNIPIL